MALLLSSTNPEQDVINLPGKQLTVCSCVLETAELEDTIYSHSKLASSMLQQFIMGLPVSDSAKHTDESLNGALVIGPEVVKSVDPVNGYAPILFVPAAFENPQPSNTSLPLTSIVQSPSATERNGVQDTIDGFGK